MAVKVRLRRMGALKRPFFRIVAADERFATSGRFLETLGWYDPKMEGDNAQVDIARVEYWKSQGAALTNTVKSIYEKAKAKGVSTPVAAEPVSE